MTESTITAADADRIWQALTAQTIAHITTAERELLDRALQSPGAIARTVAANIRGYGYTIYASDGRPDHDYACKRLADELVDGNALNDRWTVNDRGASAEAYWAAKLRQDTRAAIMTALLRLSDDAWHALIDRMADAADARAA